MTEASDGAAGIPGLAEGMAFGEGFTLLRRLGSGGMGEVWLAREKSLRRDVALKIMRPTLADDAAAERARRRFDREGRLLAQCAHPSILPIWKTGTDAATGLPYYATRACLLSADEERRLREGLFGCPLPAQGGDAPRPVSLADVLRGGATLPDGAAARVGRSLVAAVAYAHALPEPIVHRDIKPSNILFTGDGGVVLTDFGVAKRLRSDDSGGTETTTDSRRQGLFVGTFAYSAPEQQSGGEVSPATDYYAIGAILYEAVTGTKPRSLEMPSKASSARISGKWDGLLKRMLESDPSRRLTDPAVIDAALADIEGARPGTRRRMAAVAAAAVAALAAASLVVFALDGRSPAPAGAVVAPRRMEIALPGGLPLGFAWVADGAGFWIAEHELTAAESAAVFGQPVEIPEDRKDKPILAHFGATSPEVHLMEANLTPLPAGCRLDLPTEAEWEAAARAGLAGPSPEICREPRGPLDDADRPAHVIRKASTRLPSEGGTPAAFRFVLREKRPGEENHPHERNEAAATP